MTAATQKICLFVPLGHWQIIGRLLADWRIGFFAGPGSIARYIYPRWCQDQILLGQRRVDDP